MAMFYYPETSSESRYICSSEYREEPGAEVIERRILRCLADKERRHVEFISWLSEKEGWGSATNGADQYGTS